MQNEEEAPALGSLTKDEINRTIQAAFSIPTGGSINVHIPNVADIENVKSRDVIRETLLNAAAAL